MNIDDCLDWAGLHCPKQIVSVECDGHVVIDSLSGIDWLCRRRCIMRDVSINVMNISRVKQISQLPCEKCPMVDVMLIRIIQQLHQEMLQKRLLKCRLYEGGVKGCPCEQDYWECVHVLSENCSLSDIRYPKMHSELLFSFSISK